MLKAIATSAVMAAAVIVQSANAMAACGSERPTPHVGIDAQTGEFYVKAWDLEAILVQGKVETTATKKCFGLPTREFDKLIADICDPTKTVPIIPDTPINDKSPVFERFCKGFKPLF